MDVLHIMTECPQTYFNTSIETLPVCIKTVSQFRFWTFPWYTESIFRILPWCSNEWFDEFDSLETEEIPALLWWPLWYWYPSIDIYNVSAALPPFALQNLNAITCTVKELSFKNVWLPLDLVQVNKRSSIMVEQFKDDIETDLWWTIDNSCIGQKKQSGSTSMNLIHSGLTFYLNIQIQV